MADLSQLTTDRRLAFTKYVTDNKKLAEIEFEIEKGKTATFYSINNNILSVKGTINTGSKLKIINRQLIELSKLRLAEVKYNNQNGFVEIKNIRKPTGGNGTQYEDEVVDAINEYINTCGGKINLKLEGDNKIYNDLSYAIKVDSVIKTKGNVRGDPKADIIICKDKNYPLAQGSIFISHKKAGGPEAFQQYGGVSEQAGQEIYNHVLVQKFLKILSELIGNSNKLPNPVMGIYNDNKLTNMSIFGPDFGKAFSLQHVQLIGQGYPKWKNIRDGEYYELSFSHISLSGDLSKFNGGYTPVFGATYRSGRGFLYDGKRYDGARVGIYPRQLVETRSGLIKVQL